MKLALPLFLAVSASYFSAPCVLAKAQEVLPITGRVVDERNLPLADVSITASQPGIDSIFTVTDEDGEFNVAGLHGGPLALRFERAGYVDLERYDFFAAGAPVSLALGSAAPTPLHEAIALTPGEPISFVAIDEFGEPIPFARAYALDIDAPHGTGSAAGHLLGATNNEGLLTTRRLPLGPYSVLLQAGPEHPITRFDGVHAGPNAEPNAGPNAGRSVDSAFELTAPTGVPLEGRIHADGPNRSFAVWALPVDEAPALNSTVEAQHRQGFVRVRADDLGRFKFDGLWPNTNYWIRALPVSEEDPLVIDAHSPALYVQTMESRPLSDQDVQSVRLDCDFRSDTLVLELRDEEGEPLRELEIQAWFEGIVRKSPIRATTNEEGRLRITGVRAKERSGRIRLRIDALGRAPLDLGNLLLAGGASMKLGKRRWPAADLRQLAVLSPDESPLTGARVEFVSELDPRIVYRVVTDTTGLANFEVPKNGDALKVRVEALGYAPFEDRITFNKAEPIARLEAGATLDVLVTDLDGVPLPGRFVRLIPTSTGADATLSHTFSRTFSQWTDRHGRTRFAGLAAGRYELIHGQSKDDVPPHHWTYVDLKKSSVESAELQKHNFIVDRQSRFAGQLNDEGAPLVGAHVRYIDSADEELSSATKLARSVMETRTDADGRFVLYGPPPGRHLLGVRHPRRSLETLILVNVDFERVVFDTEGAPIVSGDPPPLRYEDFALPNGVVRGRVLTHDGQPFPFAEIALATEWNLPAIEPESLIGKNAAGLSYERPGLGTRVYADREGRFEIRGLPELRGLMLSGRGSDGYIGSKRIHGVDPDRIIEDVLVELVPDARIKITNASWMIPANRPLQAAARRALILTRDGEFSIDSIPHVAHPFRISGAQSDQPFEALLFDGLAPGRWQVIEAELDSFGRIIEAEGQSHSRLSTNAELWFEL